MQKIAQAVEPVYRTSPIYTSTIWQHVSRVAKFAEDFAVKLGLNRFIAEAGGWLHDLGAAKYGKDNHHVTGAQEAVPVLLSCDCPVELIGPIVSTIYSHRGSQRIAFKVPEAKCVAAADAQDHFTNLNELWRVQVEDLGVPEILVYQTISEKLMRDWEKTDPEIRLLLDGAYKRAKQELLEISSRNGRHKKRSRKS